MTGAYLRVKRDGQWQAVEIDQMTDAELDAWIIRAKENGDDGFQWAKMLARWIRERVKKDEAVQP